MLVQELKDKSLEIRKRIIDIFSYGERGHIPSAFSITEILTTLYYQKIDYSKIINADETRDRFILSKGHGCLALYAILWDIGILKKDQVQNFCKIGGELGGHPTKGKIRGIEASTGSLGMGPSIGIGMSVYLQHHSPSSQIYVVTGDGELNEGSVWEAFLSAGNKNLNNYTLIVDYNKYQSYGATKNVCDLDPLAEKFQAFKFETFEVDMVEAPEQLLEILNKEKTNKPRAIICHTIKGQGSKLIENDPSWHHKNKITNIELQNLRESLVL